MSDQQFDDEIDLGDLFLTILGEWRIVVSFAAPAVLLSAVYAFVIAPTQYRAEASLRGIPQAYCPPSFECAVSLVDAVVQATADISTDVGFSSLDAALNLYSDVDFAEEGEFAETKSRRKFFEAVDVSADGMTAAVLVTHSSDRRAIEIANAIASYIVSEVELRAAENSARYEENLKLRLATIPAPLGIMSQSEALIQRERSSIEARLESLGAHLAELGDVAVISQPASLPAELVAPRRSLILALGAVLGVFFGVGAAIASSMRRGRLHSFGAVVGAFGGGDAVLGRYQDVTNGAAHTFWQDVKVSLGEFSGGAIVVTGFADDDVMVHSAMGLASEFSGSGLPVAVVDLGARLETPATGSEFGDGVLSFEADGDVQAYGCNVKQSADVIAGLSADGGIVIVLPPPPERDLSSVRGAILQSKGWVVLARRGAITRGEVTRFGLAERGAAGRRVLAVI